VPAVLLTVPTAMQKSLFLPHWWPKPSSVLIAPISGGIASLSGLKNAKMVDQPTVTNRGINWAQCNFVDVTATPSLPVYVASQHTANMSWYQKQILSSSGS